MHQQSAEFDYEAILQKCSVQDTYLADSSKKLEQISIKHAEMLKIYADYQKKVIERKDYHKLLLLNCVEKLKSTSCLDKLQNDINKSIIEMQEQVSDVDRGLSQAFDQSLKIIKNIAAQYKNLDIEFDDLVISQQIQKTQNDKKLYQEKIIELENKLIETEKCLNNKNSINQDVHSLKIVNNNFKFSSQFGLIDINKAKLNLINKNINFLKQKAQELENQMII